MFMPDLQFGPHCAKKIIQYFQSTYERFEKFASAKSFVYRAIKNHKLAARTPHLNPQRDRRGEKRASTKRHNPRIVELVDEFLSERKATAPKVKRKLEEDHNLTVSIATIHRIAKDLHYRWTKPWHTDVLTPAQQYKRKIFCEALLLLTPQELLQLISTWMWTDEKWWDIVGPSSCEYVKADSDAEAKLENQVHFVLNDDVFCLNFCCVSCLFSCIVIILIACRWQDTKVKKVEFRNESTFGEESPGGGRLPGWRGLLPTRRSCFVTRRTCAWGLCLRTMGWSTGL